MSTELEVISPDDGALLEPCKRGKGVPSRRLTVREAMFVNFYLGEARFDQTRAAAMAGYRHPGRSADDLMGREAVRIVIADRVATEALSAEEVLSRLSRIAQGDVSCFIDPRVNRITLEQVRKSGMSHLIKKLTPTKRGWSIEMYNAQEALVTLGKHRGLFAEKIKLEHGIDLSQLSDEQLHELARRRQRA